MISGCGNVIGFCYARCPLSGSRVATGSADIYLAPLLDILLAIHKSITDNRPNLGTWSTMTALALGANDATPESILLNLPQEVLLHILSYLDLPDLDILSLISPTLSSLSQDPVLHRNRLRTTTPSRIEHSLFAQGCHGTLLRPSVADLVRMNVMRGLGIERRLRLGGYIYSAQSVKLYESVQRLEQARVIRVLTVHLGNRAHQGLGMTRGVVLPSETVSPLISRRLLPVIARLKWSMTRDRLARRVRVESPEGGMITDVDHFKAWFEARGRLLIQESERVRLAICPSVGRIVKIFEELSSPL